MEFQNNFTNKSIRAYVSTDSASAIKQTINQNHLKHHRKLINFKNYLFAGAARFNFNTAAGTLQHLKQLNLNKFISWNHLVFWTNNLFYESAEPSPIAGCVKVSPSYSICRVTLNVKFENVCNNDFCSNIIVYPDVFVVDGIIKNICHILLSQIFINTTFVNLHRYIQILILKSTDHGSS